MLVPGYCLSVEKIRLLKKMAVGSLVSEVIHSMKKQVSNMWCLFKDKCKCSGCSADL